MEEIKQFLNKMIIQSRENGSKSGSAFAYYFNLGRVAACHETLEFIANKEIQAKEQRNPEKDRGSLDE